MIPLSISRDPSSAFEINKCLCTVLSKMKKMKKNENMKILKK